MCCLIILNGSFWKLSIDLLLHFTSGAYPIHSRVCVYLHLARKRYQMNFNTAKTRMQPAACSTAKWHVWTGLQEELIKLSKLQQYPQALMPASARCVQMLGEGYGLVSGCCYGAKHESQGRVHPLGPWEAESCCRHSPRAALWFLKCWSSGEQATAAAGPRQPGLHAGTEPDPLSPSSRPLAAFGDGAKGDGGAALPPFIPALKWKQNWAQWALQCGMTGGWALSCSWVSSESWL